MRSKQGQHRGEVAEHAIRKSGYSITKVATQMGMSRNTLYSKFQNPDLPLTFLVALGKVIHHDFTHQMPELSAQLNEAEETLNRLNNNTLDLLQSQRKYIDMLEAYNKLLSLLVRVANENDIERIRQSISAFLDM